MPLMSRTNRFKMPIFASILALVSTGIYGPRFSPNDHDDHECYRISHNLNSNMPWPKYEKWSMSWSCSQDDFAYRWLQNLFWISNMSIRVRIYFNLHLKIRILAFFQKIWESVILSNFEKQFLSVQIQHWIIIITINSRTIKFSISVCPTNTLDRLIVQDKH